MSIVRENLLTRLGYTPYCGHKQCSPGSWSRWPRTRWNGKQFQCGNCGWESSFEPEFIEQYKAAQDSLSRGEKHGR